MDLNVKVSDFATKRMIQEYTEIHSRKDKLSMIGEQMMLWTWNVQDLTRQFPGTTMLDFGCGKAYSYKTREIHKLWDIEKIILFDIGIPAYSKAPEPHEFQSVVSADVLEHIPEERIDEVLEYWYSGGTQFVFATVASYLARAKLSDGSNAHVTIKSKEWWEEKIRKHQTCHTELIYLEARGRGERLVFKK